MRYGVIGTGWIAKSFIDGARQICGSEFTAVYSRTTESGNKFTAENNIETVYTDINEFAKGDFDAVYIASPNSLHYEQSKLMLENGKHVICGNVHRIGIRKERTLILKLEGCVIKTADDRVTRRGELIGAYDIVNGYAEYFIARIYLRDKGAFIRKIRIARIKLGNKQQLAVYKARGDKSARYGGS